MKVSVSYMSQLKKAAGTSREIVEVDTGTTVEDFLLRTLCTRSADMARAILEENGKLRSILLVFVGDRQADLQAPTPLKEGDEVTLMMPIAGG
ncbi:MAG: MoaD/ThiS family protein [Acidihalobacter sp.]|uniref:MoaD/ThiS family protein n=1 Tax=Acidihalobacter sp. TaxID=1872108 RepID=UPI00307F1528